MAKKRGRLWRTLSKHCKELAESRGSFVIWPDEAGKMVRRLREIRADQGEDD